MQGFFLFNPVDFLNDELHMEFECQTKELVFALTLTSIRTKKS